MDVPPEVLWTVVYLILHFFFEDQDGRKADVSKAANDEDRLQDKHPRDGSLGGAARRGGEGAQRRGSGGADAVEVESTEAAGAGKHFHQWSCPSRGF